MARYEENPNRWRGRPRIDPEVEKWYKVARRAFGPRKTEICPVEYRDKFTRLPLLNGYQLLGDDHFFRIAVHKLRHNPMRPQQTKRRQIRQHVRYAMVGQTSKDLYHHLTLKPEEMDNGRYLIQIGHYDFYDCHNLNQAISNLKRIIKLLLEVDYTNRASQARDWGVPNTEIILCSVIPVPVLRQCQNYWTMISGFNKSLKGLARLYKLRYLNIHEKFIYDFDAGKTKTNRPRQLINYTLYTPDSPKYGQIDQLTIKGIDVLYQALDGATQPPKERERNSEN